MTQQNMFFPSEMTAGFTSLLIVLIVWSIIWKGLALWRAAKRGDTVWFIIFMFLNTAGILEIVYYYLIAKTDRKN